MQGLDGLVRLSELDPEVGLERGDEALAGEKLLALGNTFRHGLQGELEERDSAVRFRQGRDSHLREERLWMASNPAASAASLKRPLSSKQ